MDRVFDSRQKPFDQVHGVGVAIAEVGHDQRHIGLLHQDTDGRVLLLELQWHHRLASDEADGQSLWVQPAVPPKRLAQVSDVCRLIWRANQKRGIPYGFSAPTECFDAATGRYLIGPTQLGLTCATFVLAVFHRAGLPLVDYDSWPADRPGDREWQENVVRLLEKTAASADHITAVRADAGAVRFRPEDVAGAATVSPLPAHFESAAERAQQILEALRDRSDAP